MSLLQFTREQELEFWKAYVEKDDIKALKKLKYSLRPFIFSIVNGKINTDGSVTEAQILARIDATLPTLLKKYNPNQGVQLNTFLKSHLDGIVRNAVKENQLEAHVPRTEAPQLNHYRDGLQAAQIEFGPNPTNQQILQFAPQLQSLSGVERAKKYHVRTTIGDATHGDGDDPLQFKDQFTNNGFSQNDLDVSLKMNELKVSIQSLNPQEKRVIEEYVFNGKNMTDIALTLGLSSSQVRRIIKSWQETAKQRGLV